jgi:glycosyltransferase involved in cell wall biosynthesis
MKIFVLGIPHTQTTTGFTTCAFTMKAFNLCRMMTRLGHTVYHLGTEGSNPECTEHVSVASLRDWTRLYGEHKKTDFYNLETRGKFKQYMDRWAAKARSAILDRVEKPYEAIVCCTWGGAQRVATDGLDQFIVESGIGYPNTWTKYRVFESYAWLHMHLGKENKFGGGCWQDAVIPNAFNPEMFGPVVADWKARSPDFLFIGRLNDDKGVKLAIHIAKEAGRSITIVGQGDPARLLKDNPHVKYLPPVGVDERRELMRKARAVICPSYYVEPFAGVNVEAQLSGTPVITTDWGAFPETVLHGQTGYRCRTFEQFVWAAKNIENISPQMCHEWASHNYSLYRVAKMYDTYFRQVLNIAGQGWYEENPARTELDWLRRYYPAGSGSEPLTLESKPS